MANESPSPVPPLNLALKLFLPLTVLNTGWFLWLQSNYESGMPTVPQPETGRVQELLVDRGTRIFVTESEAALYSRLTTIEFVLVFCLLVAVYYWLRKKPEA